MLLSFRAEKADLDRGEQQPARFYKSSNPVRNVLFYRRNLNYYHVILFSSTIIIIALSRHIEICFSDDYC